MMVGILDNLEFGKSLLYGEFLVWGYSHSKYGALWLCCEVDQWVLCG